MAEAKSVAALKLGKAMESARGGLSQEEVAEGAGVHSTNYGQYERGEKHIRIDTLLRVAYALGVPAAELVADLSAADLAGFADLKTGTRVHDENMGRRQRRRGRLTG